MNRLLCILFLNRLYFLLLNLRHAFGGYKHRKGPFLHRPQACRKRVLPHLVRYGVYKKFVMLLMIFHGIIPFSYILLLNRREIINNRGIGA